MQEGLEFPERSKLSFSLTAQWWSCLLLLANITTSTLPMILGPVLVMNIAEMVVSTQPIIAGSFVGVGEPMTTKHSDDMGPEITRNALFSNIKRLMLLVSGDIESNPGPGTGQNYEQVLKLINNTGCKDEKNLCFVNTSLQLLYSIPEVRHFFKDRIYRTGYKGRLPVSDEIFRIFKAEGQSRTTASELRRLVGHFHGRLDVCDGSQQDMEEFTRLLLECLEKELENVNTQSSRFMEKFIGQDMNMKLFINTRDGACKMGHKPRSDPVIFRTVRVPVPDTDKELSLNNMIHNHYNESAENVMMKCSDCCPHPTNCPQSGMCRLMEAAEKKSILIAPMFLYVQLLRFNDHNRKIESIVVPESILVLPNGEKYKLLSIGNHLGSRTTNGHYEALIKLGSTWMKANDDTNYKINIESQINGANYIFLYKKFSTSSQFAPSETWEEVLENQPIPPGLHVKFDIQTGQQFARLVDGTEKAKGETENMTQ